MSLNCGLPRSGRPSAHRTGGLAETLLDLNVHAHHSKYWPCMRGLALFLFLLLSMSSAPVVRATRQTGNRSQLIRVVDEHDCFTLIALPQASICIQEAFAASRHCSNCSASVYAAMAHQMLQRGTQQGLNGLNQQAVRPARRVRVSRSARLQCLAKDEKWTPPPAWPKRVVVPEVEPRSDPKVMLLPASIRTGQA